MTGKHPPITVLMTVYNGLPYLPEAIKSVVDQTFRHFEFLIIDDASSDDSVNCIKSFHDCRIRLVCNEENMGQAFSLNKGLKLSRGKYIARLDQDDVCLPKRLEEQFGFLEENPHVAAACTWEDSVDSFGRKVRHWRRKVHNFGEFLGLLLVAKCPIWHPSVMFRRLVIDELGGYDESLAPAEDFDLWARMAMHRFEGAIIPKTLVLQRVHNKRQSVSKAKEQWQNMRHAHDRLVQSFCPSLYADRLARFLRLPTDAATVIVPEQELFWGKYHDQEDIRLSLLALDELLHKAKVDLNLSSHELASLSRLLIKRLGFGVGIRRFLVRLPRLLFYPTFYVLSPMLSPNISRALSYCNDASQELRYPLRSFQARLGEKRRLKESSH